MATELPEYELILADIFIQKMCFGTHYHLLTFFSSLNNNIGDNYSTEQRIGIAEIVNGNRSRNIVEHLCGLDLIEPIGDKYSLTKAGKKCKELGSIDKYITWQTNQKRTKSIVGTSTTVFTILGSIAGIVSLFLVLFPPSCNKSQNKNISNKTNERKSTQNNRVSKSDSSVIVRERTKR